MTRCNLRFTNTGEDGNQIRRGKGGEAVNGVGKVKKRVCIGFSVRDHKSVRTAAKTNAANDASRRPNRKTNPIKESRTMIWISESEDGAGASQRSSNSIRG